MIFETTMLQIDQFFITKILLFANQGRNYFNDINNMESGINRNALVNKFMSSEDRKTKKEHTRFNTNIDGFFTKVFSFSIFIFDIT